MSINTQTDGGTALGSDEYIINRAGVDFKQSHTQIVAGVTTLIATESSTRTSEILNLTNTKLELTGGTMTGLLFLSGAPSLALHAATKDYVDTADALAIPLAGGVMTGLLTLSGDPSSSLHPATKEYTDLADALLLPLAGGVLTGALILDANPSVALGASTKQYSDDGDAGRWTNSVDLNCGANPNYPVSLKGVTYRVSVGGKIGGVSGKVVQVDDIIYCHTADPVGGTQASVGASYSIIQTNLVQASQSEAGYLAISTDLAIKTGTSDIVAITPLGLRSTVNELVPNHNRISTASLAVVVPVSTQSTLYLLTGSGAGVVGVTIPEISTITGSAKITLTFKDAGINASVNNITITASGSDTIDGAATSVISADGDKVTLVTDGSTAWYVV